MQCCGPGRQAKPLGRQRPLRNEGRPAPRVEARETFLIENDRVESRRSPEDGAGRVRGRAQLRRGSAGRLRGQDNTRPPSASPVLREPSRTKLGRRSPVVENAGGGIGDGSARRGVRGGRRGEHRLLGRSARSELSRALARGSVVGHRGPRDHTAHRPHVRRGVDHGSFSDRSEKPSSPGTPGDGEIELRYFWPAQVIPAHAGGWQFHSCGTPGGSIIPRAHGAAGHDRHRRSGRERHPPRAWGGPILSLTSDVGSPSSPRRGGRERNRTRTNARERARQWRLVSSRGETARRSVDAQDVRNVTHVAPSPARARESEREPGRGGRAGPIPRARGGVA